MGPVPPAQDGMHPFHLVSQPQQYPAVSSPQTSAYPPQQYPQGSYPPVAGQPAAAVYGYQSSSNAYNYPPQGSAESGSKGASAPATNYPPQASYVPAPYPPPAASAATASYYADPNQHYSTKPTAAAVAASTSASAVMGTPAFMYSQEGNEPCGCSAGWVLFGVGWIFPICWLIGAFLPCCSRNRNDRRAAIGSGIMLALTVIAVVVAVVVSVVMVAKAAESINNGSNNWNTSYNQLSSYSNTP